MISNYNFKNKTNLKMARATFNLGRILVALTAIAIGVLMFLDGSRVYDKYLHELRKMYLPKSKGSDIAFGTGLTFEVFN